MFHFFALIPFSRLFSFNTPQNSCQSGMQEFHFYVLFMWCAKCWAWLTWDAYWCYKRNLKWKNLINCSIFMKKVCTEYNFASFIMICNILECGSKSLYLFRWNKNRCQGFQYWQNMSIWVLEIAFLETSIKFQSINFNWIFEQTKFNSVSGILKRPRKNVALFPLNIERKAFRITCKCF